MPVLALKQPIASDAEGVSHPDAIYIPSDIHMAVIIQQGNVEWRAYHDEAALLSEKEPLPDCGHNTVISVADNQRIFNYEPPAGTPANFGAQVSAALVFAAQTVLDTPAYQADGVTPQLDPATGQPVMVAFFANAQVVSVGP